jgi:hypothetical protein
VTAALGPALEHRVSRATRYTEQQLDATGTASWEDTRDHLAKTLDIKHELTITPVLRAVIDLESNGALAHDVDTGAYRRPLPTDPQAATVAEVADAVLALGWPTAADGDTARCTKPSWRSAADTGTRTSTGRCTSGSRAASSSSTP